MFSLGIALALKKANFVCQPSIQFCFIIFWPVGFAEFFCGT